MPSSPLRDEKRRSYVRVISRSLRRDPYPDIFCSLSLSQTLQKGWKKNLDAGAPLPEKWLLSPMTRAADTMALTWGANLRNQTPIFCEVSHMSQRSQ
jgi:hypothetical protein